MVAHFTFSLLLFLALASNSSAMYCLCKDGISESQLQKNIDFACASGADCGPILENGPCFKPNSTKDHCSYAVNSYYQRQSLSESNCNFSGSAALSSTPPTAGSCFFQSTARNNSISMVPYGQVIPMGHEPSSVGALRRPTLIIFLTLISLVFFQA